MHIGGKIGQALEKPFQYADAAMHHYDNWLRSNNAPDVYVGYNSNTGFNASINTNTQQAGIPNSKPTAYSANAAKTASSIKQGGMTKDEVQDFNIKHPNETAIRGNE